jgi:hypothetical protein
MNFYNTSKYKKLVLGILFDAFGYISIIFPPFDFVWAPASAWLMIKLYKGKKGKVAALISFVEEALPFLDVIPTFTLMWIFTYLFSTENKSKDTIIDNN